LATISSNISHDFSGSVMQNWRKNKFNITIIAHRGNEIDTKTADKVDVTLLPVQLFRIGELGRLPKRLYQQSQLPFGNM
jgi:hypothetical protein